MISNMISRKNYLKLRSPEQIREHYEIEKELATKLKNSVYDERKLLYTSVYDELFRRVPHHPQLTRKKSLYNTYKTVNNKLKLFKHFLNREVNFMEIGPGDCALSLRVSKFVKHVWAIDVSKEIIKNISIPLNFTLVVSDGSSIPLDRNSIQIAFSNHLMEHLHPDDAFQQLNNIFKSLVNDGKYICITPNRLSGPHDISRYFDEDATGLHLKEYTVGEITMLFREVGFSKIRFYAGGKGIYIRIPMKIVIMVEKLLLLLPGKFRKLTTQNFLIQAVLGINLVAFK